MVGCSVCSVADSALVRCVEEGAKPKGEALDSLVDRCSYPQLRSQAEGSDQKNKIVEESRPPHGLGSP